MGRHVPGEEALALALGVRGMRVAGPVVRHTIISCHVVVF